MLPKGAVEAQNGRLGRGNKIEHDRRNGNEAAESTDGVPWPRSVLGRLVRRHRGKLLRRSEPRFWPSPPHRPSALFGGDESACATRYDRGTPGGRRGFRQDDFPSLHAVQADRSPSQAASRSGQKSSEREEIRFHGNSPDSAVARCSGAASNGCVAASYARFAANGSVRRRPVGPARRRRSRSERVGGRPRRVFSCNPARMSRGARFVFSLRKSGRRAAKFAVLVSRGVAPDRLF